MWQNVLFLWEWMSCNFLFGVIIAVRSITTAHEQRCALSQVNLISVTRIAESCVYQYKLHEFFAFHVISIIVELGLTSTKMQSIVGYLLAYFLHLDGVIVINLSTLKDNSLIFTGLKHFRASATEFLDIALPFAHTTMSLMASEIPWSYTKSIFSDFSFTRDSLAPSTACIIKWPQIVTMGIYVNQCLTAPTPYVHAYKSKLQSTKPLVHIQIRDNRYM